MAWVPKGCTPFSCWKSCLRRCFWGSDLEKDKRCDGDVSGSCSFVQVVTALPCRDAALTLKCCGTGGFRLHFPAILLGFPAENEPLTMGNLTVLWECIMKNHKHL